MELIDKFQRRIKYLRFSVTDRCDLRCFYCLPKGFNDFEEPEEWLTVDEIERIIRLFSELGVHRIRLTGGEPLTRKGIDDIITKIAALPKVTDLSLSTNATQLSSHADAIKSAGVTRINVSLDSLNPETFKDITGGKLEKALSGIMAAKEAGLSPIKINMVIMNGINDHEIIDMVEFCLKNDFTLRFIETMPVGSTGDNISKNHYIDLKEIKARLEQKYKLTPGEVSGGGPAEYYAVGDSKLHIGFITPISQHFCDTCNRVRLSVDGTLYLCLGENSKVELRPLIQSDASDDEIKQAILDAVDLKPERHLFDEGKGEVLRFMNTTGG